MNIWSSESYQKNAAYVPALGAAVLDLLDPKAGERILDLGCGDGALTEKIVSVGAAVLGVDNSPEMLAAAKARGLAVRAMGVEDLTFSREFDAVFSNAVLHWVRDHDAMLDGVHRALKPGGRFVAEFGGHGNLAAIQTAIRAFHTQRGLPLAGRRYYATDTEYAERLAIHGFSVQQIALIPRPTPLPYGMRGWLETFERHTLAKLPDDLREPFKTEVEDLLRSELCDRKGQWTADYVRLRFAAIKS